MAPTPTIAAEVLGLTFLDPPAGILAAGIAAPIVVLLYFLKLRRRPVRVSAVFLWARAAEDLQVNVPLKWPRASWLLLLQLLGLLVLCAAIARPAVSSDVGDSGSVIIMIDASAAMAAEDAPGPEGAPISRLAKAKRSAREMIDRMSLGSASGDGQSRAMVLSFAAGAKVETPFTASRAELRRAVDAVEQTDQPANLDAALGVVRAFAFAGEENEDARVRPVLILLSGGGFERAPLASRQGAGGADVRFVRIGPPPQARRDNLGIAALSARRDEERPSAARVFVRVVNAGPEGVEAPLIVRVNGEAARAVTIDIPGAPARTRAASPAIDEVPAPDALVGERSTSVEIEAPGRSLIEAAIERPDALASDNVAAIVLDEPRPPRIILVAPEDAGGKPSPDPALAHALRVVAGQGSVRIAGASSFLAGAETQYAADLIVFDRVRPARTPALPTLSFAAGLPIEGLALAQPEAGSSTPFVSWRRAHPVMRGVVLDNVAVGLPMTLALPDGAAALASGRDGPLIALLEDRGVGRIIVGFEVERSGWWLNVSFAVFVANSVERLIGRSEAALSRSFTTTEPVSIRAALGASRLTLEGPGAASFALDERAAIGPPVPGAGPLVSIGLLPRAGVYRAEGAADADRLIPVNLSSPGASSLQTDDSVDIGGARVAAGGAGGATPREVWPWFALGAIALLTLEWVLFAWRMRV